MKMKRNVEARFYCYFCCRHILITFVVMTLLIMNYGVDTALMSDVPHGNGNSNSYSNSYSKSYSNSNKHGVVTTKNANNIGNNSSNSKETTIWIANDENIITENVKQIENNNNNENRNETTNLLKISLLETQAVNNENNNNIKTRVNDNDATIDNYVDSKNSLSSIKNHTLPHPVIDVMQQQLRKFRKARIFGLFGTNFSLSYNLSLTTGNSAGNITIAAPAPAAYYASAPYYPYSYSYGYNPYGYGYDPYGYYNPYAYNPYAGYGYYG